MASVVAASATVLPLASQNESLKQDICVLLHHIHGSYKAALDRLPMPALGARLLKAGMRIGFLDSVSNIIVNTIAYSPPPSDEEDEDVTESKILSQIITDTSDKSVFEVPLSPEKAAGMTIARRSLDGLVRFLTSHFRYLADTEALRYLRLAKADLLTAVRLIERDRNKKCKDELAFNIASLTTKIALECAALSARHPVPDVLVKASVIMTSPQIDFTVLLAGRDPTLSEFLRQARMSMNRPLNLCGKEKNKKRKRSNQTYTPTESIEGGRAQNRLGSTFRYTQSLMLLLLGKIHGLYLQALAKLPRDGLHKYHHSSLLKGGYCYGPRDPVSNIILNTIWYGSMFPTPQEFELQFKVGMICTDMLARIEYCSLYGLVALLRACLPSLTEQEALWYLFSSDADVHEAIRKAKKHGHAHAVCEEDNHLHDAYRQAAVASWHPDPDALVEFATSSLNMESAEVLAILQQCKLTSGAVECLAISLAHTRSEKQISSSQVLSKNQKRFISEFRKKFRHDQNFFVRKVNEVLSNYSQEKGVHYKLHIICGVNPRVPEGSSAGLAMRNFKFEYFHINFLATAKGPNSALTAPQLFFAQCSNKVKLKEPSFCTPVQYSFIDNVRCFPCEYNGAKIVHPYDATYSGCCDDFKLMAKGEHGTWNELIISACDFNVDKMCTMTKDWIYFDPNIDSKFAEKNPISNVARELRGWKGGRIF
uniref:Uncharacterized protein n=1 Tax=Avena sativa TaxID=4498 RepID=A0ACD5UR83_AVESA